MKEPLQNKNFEGWYFKHQKGAQVLAFIPGRAAGGAFVQMLSSTGSRFFPITHFLAAHDLILADRCVFSRYGCQLDLPGVSGQIQYGSLVPLCLDIMGPFALLPMPCRHGVVSMMHRLSGGVTIDGLFQDFTGGTGYIEKDSGSSFPPSYQWLQCNCFAVPCALMVALAEIPLLGFSFTGCICALLYGGHEYRLTTYRGAKICKAQENYICLTQGRLTLELFIQSNRQGAPLQAPVQGKMERVVREQSNVQIHLLLWCGSDLRVDLGSNHAMYERF